MVQKKIKGKHKIYKSLMAGLEEMDKVSKIEIYKDAKWAMK